MEREVRATRSRRRHRVWIAALVLLAMTGLSVAPAIASADPLPDGRAYELVTPGLNGVNVEQGHPIFTQATASGDGLAFVGTDAADCASSSGIYNAMASTRGSSGWTVECLAVPFSVPESVFTGTYVSAVSSDLSQYLVSTDQPLTSNAGPGENLFLGTAGGSYQLLTPVPSASDLGLPTVEGVSADFSHVFFTPKVGQLAGDKVNYASGGYALYQWSGGQLSVVSVPPKGTKVAHLSDLASPGVTNLTSVSANGDAVLFDTGGFPGASPVYVRLNGTSTIVASASQRTPADPSGSDDATAVGITSDGTQVLFTSSAELTDNANTGDSSSPDSGNDLYDYDVTTGQLTDLTPDSNAADKATGADVQAVIGAADDASYVYFIATGDLASGAKSGRDNLYVEHDGTTTYIAPATGIASAGNVAYTTPDGQHLAFESTDSLTGYDNLDQATGQPDTEVYEYDAPSGTLVCASCRPDGVQPTGSSTIPVTAQGNGLGAPPRVVSDDGGRVFFDSTDQVVPGATNGLQNVYEYEGGDVYLISPGTGASPATLVDASASGDDVFFDSYDDVVPPLDASLQSAIWDARVGGGFPITSSTEGVCTATVQCRGTGSSATGTPTVATNGPSGQLRRRKPVAFEVERRAVRGATVVLRVRVGSAGRLVISGRELRTLRRTVRHGSAMTLRVRLTRRAQATLDRRHRLRLSIHVRFARSGGGARTLTVHVTATKGRRR